MKNKNVVLIIISSVLISGSAIAQESSMSMEAIGTGILGGLAAGAGTAILCNKMTNGKYKAGCVALGAGVGVAVGNWAASLDDEAEKAVPAMDCATVKTRMNFTSDSNKPVARLSIENGQPTSFVVKPGESLKIPIRMDLATPGEAGSEEAVAFKIISTDGADTYTGAVITKECGGDYPLPLSLPTNTEGVFKTSITLLNASNNIEIEGGSITICYTVSNNGVNKCSDKQEKTAPSTNSKTIKKINE